MKRTFTRQWLQLSIIWIVIALVPIGRVYLVDPFPMQVWFYLIILVFGLLLCPLLVWWFSWLQRKKQTWIRIILIQFVLSVLLSLWFYKVVDERPGLMKRRTSKVELQQMQPEKKFSFYLFSGNSYYIFTSLMMLSGLGLLIGYNEQLRARKTREAELEISLVRSQVKALQSELQPHFLFNTLHAASSLMETDVAKAQELIERLSFLLRSYLDIIDREFYSLQEELDFIDEYIAIQQLRHNGSIVTTIDIPQDCKQLQVPVVLLQPILENSVKHGWVDRKRELRILIRAVRVGDFLHVTVKDNGDELPASQKAGIGIRNLKERLAVLYGDKYKYSEGWDDGYYSQMILPIQK